MLDQDLYVSMEPISGFWFWEPKTIVFWLYSAGSCDSLAKLKKQRNRYIIFLVEWVIIKVI